MQLSPNGFQATIYLKDQISTKPYYTIFPQMLLKIGSGHIDVTHTQ